MLRGGRLAQALAGAYLIALALTVIAFQIVGERHWAVTLAMYLPRLGFLLPMPFVAFALVIARRWVRALTVCVASSLIVVFPLMGYEFSGPGETAGTSLRLMTWNTAYGRLNNEAIRRSVDHESPDIFLSQATAQRTKELFRADPRSYSLESDDEFFLASRFPVIEKLIGPRLEQDPVHKAGFVRYTLDTPLGRIDLYHVHPISPRPGLEQFRGIGLRTRLLRGDVPDEALQPTIANTLLRRRQVEALMATVMTSTNPILIAGDTNLPGRSWLFKHTFGQLRDAFADAGDGFGYTFPASRPWMRIDRIMSDTGFRFVRVGVGEIIASDHRYVVADVTRAGPRG